MAWWCSSCSPSSSQKKTKICDKLEKKILCFAQLRSWPIVTFQIYLLICWQGEGIPHLTSLAYVAQIIHNRETLRSHGRITSNMWSSFMALWLYFGFMVCVSEIEVVICFHLWSCIEMYTFWETTESKVLQTSQASLWKFKVNVEIPCIVLLKKALQASQDATP